jgi:hypothetical protein
MADGSDLEGVFWLPRDLGRESRVTPIEAILDGSKDFFPFGLQGGENALICRAAIRHISLPAKSPGLQELPPAGVSFDLVRVRLDSGEEISGILRVVTPDGAARMSDIFNSPARFVVLDLGDRIVLVNKSRVVRVFF